MGRWGTPVPPDLALAMSTGGDIYCAGFGIIFDFSQVLRLGPRMKGAGLWICSFLCCLVLLSHPRVSNMFPLPYFLSVTCFDIFIVDVSHVYPDHLFIEFLLLTLPFIPRVALPFGRKVVGPACITPFTYFVVYYGLN